MESSQNIKPKFSLHPTPCDPKPFDKKSRETDQGPNFKILFFVSKPAKGEDIENHKFLIPREIAKKSHSLGKWIYPPPKGVKVFRIDLPDVDCQSFTLYAHYIISGNIPLFHMDPQASSGPDPGSLSWHECLPLINAYICGVQFKDKKFQDRIMDVLRLGINQNQPFPDKELIKKVFGPGGGDERLQNLVFDKITGGSGSEVQLASSVAMMPPPRTHVDTMTYSNASTSKEHATQTGIVAPKPMYGQKTCRQHRPGSYIRENPKGKGRLETVEELTEDSPSIQPQNFTPPKSSQTGATTSQRPTPSRTRKRSTYSLPYTTVSIPRHRDAKAYRIPNDLPPPPKIHFGLLNALLETAGTESHLPHVTPPHDTHPPPITTTPPSINKPLPRAPSPSTTPFPPADYLSSSANHILASFYTSRASRAPHTPQISDLLYPNLYPNPYPNLTAIPFTTRPSTADPRPRTVPPPALRIRPLHPSQIFPPGLIPGPSMLRRKPLSSSPALAARPKQHLIRPDTDPETGRYMSVHGRNELLGRPVFRWELVEGRPFTAPA
ncbi:hypothetical protein BS50DRAFT_665817 [Corynespora cassiicola Philippines]|uniref:Uncharacterized protein n=1 Tax=Corynespora cassiicola Philippines TaxID=1448308 RepID=A0A2T2NS41_CORCC|nr:hypothetical protein BS50DRAFT_665817 [Corynespora cassiicola Philippines]